MRKGSKLSKFEKHSVVVPLPHFLIVVFGTFRTLETS